MRNAIKLYTTFIPSKILKWIVYLVYPLTMMWMSAAIGGNYLFYALIVMPLAFVIEIIINVLMFKEIATKDPVRIEYIHTSDKGISLFGDVLKVDVIRRFVTILAIMMMPAIYTKLFQPDGVAAVSLTVDDKTVIEAANPLYFFVAAFMLLIIIEIDVWIARKVKSGIVDFLLSFFGYMVCVELGMMVFGFPEKMLIIATVIAVIIYALVITSCYSNIMKTEERKFYDYSEGR